MVNQTYVGIDKIGFYTPPFSLKLYDLAVARGVDPNKFNVGLGQEEMSVPSPDEDVISMAAKACQKVIHNEDLNSIDWLIFATESGIDHSKSGASFLLDLLGLPSTVRVVEFKQACYAATAALKLGETYIRCNPDKKVLVVASDIARYGLNSVAESTQGACAVAILLSSNPRVASIGQVSTCFSANVYDFWRPNSKDEAIVDGKYSCDIYLKFLANTWEEFKQKSQVSINDFAGFLFHTPLPKLVEKANYNLLNSEGERKPLQYTKDLIKDALAYNRKIGNCYTAALYLSLLSFLENTQEDLSNKHIGLYSYGSGAVGEFLSIKISPTYSKMFNKAESQKAIADRVYLTVDEYEKFYLSKDNESLESFINPHYLYNDIRFVGQNGYKRLYEKLGISLQSNKVGHNASSEAETNI